MHGFVLTESGLPFQAEGEVEDVAGDILDAPPAGEYPHLAELIAEHALVPDGLADRLARGV
ncbi:hypothetical protein [Actinomadura rifamycini]|uniref:hypothetical protein n=1 Tax=Actinomadura rifamycini TaxID=31962 RepID=UPI00040D278A|nr:hypothetical protein [Actinomadura rifamycini]